MFQTCVSANRILVQSGIHDEFVTKLKAAVEKELVMGDGSDSKTTLGPLINNAAVLKVLFCLLHLSFIEFSTTPNSHM